MGGRSHLKVHLVFFVLSFSGLTSRERQSVVAALRGRADAERNAILIFSSG